MAVPAPVPKGNSDPLLTPGEVAALFRVDPKTVTRWASAKPPKIRSVRTPGGHRRFRKSEVDAMLGEQGPDEAQG